MPNQPSGGPGNPQSGAWKQTNQNNTSDPGQNAAGCFGCLGCLVVVAAMLGVGVYSCFVFLRKGIEVSYFRGWIEANPQYGRIVLLASLLAVALGALVMWLVVRIDLKKLDAGDRELARNTESRFDQTMYRRRMSTKRVAKVLFLSGLLLYFIPLYVLPFLGAIATWIPSIPGVGEEVTVGEMGEVFIIFPFTFSMLGAGAMLVAYFIRAGGTVRVSGGKDLNKEQVVRSELERLFGNLTYIHDKGIGQQLIASTGLVGMGNTFKSNDYISGDYHGTRFEQADVGISTVEERTYYDKNDKLQRETRTTTHFSGRWMVLELPKTVSGGFQVRSRTFPGYDRKRRVQGWQDVQLEDAAFNEAFQVLATNPHDVFYVLTPPLIERLKELVGVHGRAIKEGVGMYCSQGRLHIAVSGTADAFERLFFAVTREQEVRDRVRRDISLITDLIDAVISKR